MVASVVTSAITTSIVKSVGEITPRSRPMLRTSAAGESPHLGAHAGHREERPAPALAAVVVIGRLFGRVLERFGQPPVIGDVVAGIALGPSLLGLVAPAASAYILPPPVAPYLSVVAQLGVIIYMFLVGLELNPAGARECSRR